MMAGRWRAVVVRRRARTGLEVDEVLGGMRKIEAEAGVGSVCRKPGFGGVREVWVFDGERI